MSFSSLARSLSTRPLASIPDDLLAQSRSQLGALPLDLARIEVGSGAGSDNEHGGQHEDPGAAGLLPGRAFPRRRRTATWFVDTDARQVLEHRLRFGLGSVEQLRTLLVEVGRLVRLGRWNDGHRRWRLQPAKRSTGRERRSRKFRGRRRSARILLERRRRHRRRQRRRHRAGRPGRRRRPGQRRRHRAGSRRGRRSGGRRYRDWSRRWNGSMCTRYRVDRQRNARRTWDGRRLLMPPARARGRRNRGLRRQRARHLARHRLGPDPLLQRRVHHRAVVPEPGVGVVLPELHGPGEDLFGADGIAASKQHLAEEAERAPVTRIGLAGGHERRLRLCQQPGVEIHAPDRQHHLAVVQVPGLRAGADLAHQLLAAGGSEIRTQGQGGLGVGICPPAGEQLVECAHRCERIPSSGRNLYESFMLSLDPGHWPDETSSSNGRWREGRQAGKVPASGPRGRDAQARCARQRRRLPVTSPCAEFSESTATPRQRTSSTSDCTRCSTAARKARASSRATVSSSACTAAWATSSTCLRPSSSTSSRDRTPSGTCATRRRVARS